MVVFGLGLKTQKPPLLFCIVLYIGSPTHFGLGLANLKPLVFLPVSFKRGISLFTCAFSGLLGSAALASVSPLPPEVLRVFVHSRVLQATFFVGLQKTDCKQTIYKSGGFLDGYKFVEVPRIKAQDLTQNQLIFIGRERHRMAFDARQVFAHPPPTPVAVPTVAQYKALALDVACGVGIMREVRH